MKDSERYQKKKAFFEGLITLYGRNVVDEVLGDDAVEVHTLHLAESNREEGAISRILAKAEARGVSVRYHSKQALSRISKNAKQDQGVAIDIAAPTYRSADRIGADLPERGRLLALDGVQNPQNLGMIIRSAAAGNIDGIILPKGGSAKLSPLVMKASAGTLFKLPIYYCDRLPEVLQQCKAAGWRLYALSSHAASTIHSLLPAPKAVFVLGNENEGVAPEIEALCDDALAIPMRRGVESLNVAVTAALIAFMGAEV